MNVYYSKDFEGHYPVGAAALVVAKNKGAARKLLDQQLDSEGLKQSKPYTLHKVSVSVPRVIMLLDGDY